MFDSWAGNLAPADYDIFAAPYQKKVVDAVKASRPASRCRRRRCSSSLTSRSVTRPPPSA